MTELEEMRNDIKAIKSEVEDIRDNHLSHIYNAIQPIWGAIGFLTKGVSDLKWLVIGASGLLAIVIALCSLLS